MKLLHLSDLHLGKRVNGFSMLEDQRVILTQIVDLAEEEKVDAVLLAGDLYDKPVPPAEAVTLLDGFLTRLSGGGIPVFAISGNHDSPERLAFATRLLAGEGIHLTAQYQGPQPPFLLQDEYGDVAIYALPYRPWSAIGTPRQTLPPTKRRCPTRWGNGRWTRLGETFFWPTSLSQAG